MKSIPLSSAQQARRSAADNDPDTTNTCESTKRASAWACIETLFCVLLCWGSAFYFNNSWHLIGSAVFAPCLLMGSRQSMTAPRRWFLSDLFGFEKYAGWSSGRRSAWTLGIALFASFPLAYLAWRAWGTGTNDFKWQFMLMVLIYISMPLLAVTMANSITITIVVIGGGPLAAGFVRPVARMTTLFATGALMVLIASQFEFAGRATSFSVGALMGGMFGLAMWSGLRVMLDKSSEFDQRLATISGMGIGVSVILSLGAVMGLVIRAILVRMIATLRHLLAGLTRLPQNGSEAWLSLKVLHPAELVPDLHAFRSDNTLEPSLLGWQGEMWRWRAWRLVTFSLPILAFLCRVSVKGAAWFWWPLGLWLRPSKTCERSIHSPAGPRICTANHESLWTKFSVVVALVSTALHLLRNQPWAGASCLSIWPLPLRVSLAIGWPELRLWHWLLWTAAAAGLGIELARTARGKLAEALLRSIRTAASAVLLLLTAGAIFVASAQLWEDFIHVPPRLYRHAEWWYKGDEAMIRQYGPQWRKLSAP